MAIATSMPKWSTPERKNVLVQLFLDSGGFCVYGHKPCQGYVSETQVTACKWGIACLKPVPDSELCRYKPENGKPHLPCQFVTVKRCFWNCSFGHNCAKPFGSHYESYIDTLISDWKQLDRQQSVAEWQAERKALHNLGEKTYPLTGRFNAISKDIFASNQPLYYLQGQAVSGLTLKPFVKVRLASSYMRLFVDLGEALRQVSKNKRRKAMRYGKALPQEAEAIIRRKVLEAVRDYLA